MNKKIIITVIVMVLIIGIVGFFLLNNSNKGPSFNDKEQMKNPEANSQEGPQNQEENKTPPMGNMNNEILEEACIGLSEGDTCTAESEMGTIEGICTLREEFLTCMPDEIQQRPEGIPEDRPEMLN